MAKETINSQIFTVLKVSEKSNVPVLILSNPGLGKSTTVNLFASVRGYHLQLLRGNSTSETEVLGYDVAVDNPDGSKSTVRTRPSWYNKILEKEKEGIHTLLFLDEITTAAEPVQAALLHLIFERMVGDERLPEKTLIVSAGNYAQNLSNQMNLLPPLMNRFLIFNIIPDREDVKSFLCKYKGAIASPTGKIKDFVSVLRDDMVKIDSQEKDIEESVYNKIGEYIERGLSETTLFLTKNGGPLDFKVKDLQEIYSDDNTEKLFGFVTYRSLNYLRDATLAMFKCFGKEGISSSVYRNIVDGLCGIGLSKDKSGNVKTSYVGREYYDAMVSIINDIQKMENSYISEYEKYIHDSLMTDEGKTEDQNVLVSIPLPVMNALANKIKEIKNNETISSIESPIDPVLVTNLCKKISTSATTISNIRIGSGEDLLKKVSADSLATRISYWNSLSSLLISLNDFVSDPKFMYKKDVLLAMEKSVDDARNSAYKLRSIRRVAISENSSINSMIPGLNSDLDLINVRKA